MAKARFLQIHWLASYPATLLNRDDAGLAKRLPFGGAVRGRVSSQSLKRHWRLAGADDLAGAAANPWALQTLPTPMGVRTKRLVEERVLKRALETATPAPAVEQAVREAMLKGLYGEKAVEPKNRQALFFGQPEIDYLAGVAAEAMGAGDPKAATARIETFFKEQRANLRELKNGAGLESALFGRMVTSDPAANRDAAIHVAHAFTVHALEREMDFMTAVDDLKGEADDAGAAGVFDMELTSGLYYGYVVVDVALLVSNLSKDREIAAKVVEHMLHLIAKVSPGAKKGSTAPYAWAELMLAEAGDRQPRTLANAFRDPVALKSRDNRLLGKTVEAMDRQMASLDAVYDDGLEARRQLAVGDALAGVERLPLSALAGWAAEVVRSGEA